MSAEFRVGRSVGRTIYQGDKLVGLMDTPELAERAVAAMNRAEALIDPNDPAVRERIVQAIAQDERMYVPSNYVDALADAVLAALRSKP